MKKSTIKFMATVILLTVISFAGKAQTPVSGGIYSNTTWTKAKSPYIVTDTVVVFPGYTLTIQPGVTVKFDSNAYIEIRQAKLIAIGTEIDSIDFIEATKNTSSEKLFYFNDANSASEFNFCNFHTTNTAIKTISVLSNKTLTVKNSNFINNNSGIYDAVSPFSHSGVFFIDSCVFKNNYIGITSIQGSIINNCRFLNCQNTGCNICNSTLTNSLFYLNNTGVNASLNISYKENFINNCKFVKNQTALFASGSRIINCIIDSNSLSGVSISNNPDSIRNCEINNNGVGIQILYGGNTILENIIENNNIGIKYQGGGGNFYCNKICGNSSYDFYYNIAEGSNISIPNNYWCTTDSITIASHIYDGYDNINLGLVSFMPIDSSKCYLTGCDLQITAKVTNATCDTCHNGSATAYVANGFAPYTWTWYTSPIQTTQTARGLKPGNYTICITDSKGCSACNKSVFIDSTNCSGYSITAYDSNSTCSTCADGYAWVKVKGGTPPYSYTWYTIPMQATDTAKGLIHGTYHVCVTDLYGCTACDSVTIQTGHCSAHFEIYPTSTPHVYNAVNMASGVKPLKYLWSWGDGKYDSTAYPSHAYSTAGFYKICLTITDSAGCKNTYCNSFYLKSTDEMIQVNVIPSVISGISELGITNYELGINIYPNPATNSITIDIRQSDNRLSDKNLNYQVLIKNMVGQEVLKQCIVQSAECTVNVSGLSNGVYILSIMNNESGIRNYKVVISR